MKSPHMTQASVFDTDRRHLAALLDVSADCDEKLWGDDELGAILQHQLAASIQSDLASLDRKLGRKFDNFTVIQGFPLKSFGDLFAHPEPPVGLLKAVKDFAKACRINPHSPIPHETATVLYFDCLAVALTRCHCRITSLSDTTLAEGLRWTQNQPWLDAASRALTEEALRFLGEQPQDRPA